jgi:hypothetical protein
MDHRRWHWRSGAHHHPWSLATDEWLVRFVLGFVSVPADRVALEKIRWYYVPRLGTFCRRRPFHRTVGRLTLKIEGHGTFLPDFSR